MVSKDVLLYENRIKLINVYKITMRIKKDLCEKYPDGLAFRSNKIIGGNISLTADYEMEYRLKPILAAALMEDERALMHYSANKGRLLGYSDGSIAYVRKDTLDNEKAALHRRIDMSRYINGMKALIFWPVWDNKSKVYDMVMDIAAMEYAGHGKKEKHGMHMLIMITINELGNEMLMDKAADLLMEKLPQIYADIISEYINPGLSMLPVSMALKKCLEDLKYNKKAEHGRDNDIRTHNVNEYCDSLIRSMFFSLDIQAMPYVSQEAERIERRLADAAWPDDMMTRRMIGSGVEGDIRAGESTGEKCAFLSGQLTLLRQQSDYGGYLSVLNILCDRLWKLLEYI